MSGHNKWTQIKRQKGVEDVKKSRLFGILGKTISIEAKRAGGDRGAAGLRAAIEKARAANMPNDNIDRAIKNALGASGGELAEVVYEAYGPGGVALIIEGITDNKNRTAQAIKHLLALHGGSLAAPGSVVWAFRKTTEGWQTAAPVVLSRAETAQVKKLLEALGTNNDVKNIVTNL